MLYHIKAFMNMVWAATATDDDDDDVGSALEGRTDGWME